MNVHLWVIFLCGVTYLTQWSTDAAEEEFTLDVPSLGKLRGRIGKSYFKHKKIIKFFGINYAMAPSGERRFKPPEEYGPWEGIYDATKMRQRCPQIDFSYYPSPDKEELNEKNDTEDCLVVNVFTPQLEIKKLLPVLFFIHGGSFYLGSAYHFLPDFLLEEDIVLVIPQYRLGPLGFLSLMTSEIPGNMGMMDILLALRWVKKYIQHFGGDPWKVTVSGQSAGAAAASALLISPQVETGLFDKMIIQSGSILSSWSVDDNPIKSAYGIGEMIGCSGNQNSNHKKITECLKTVPAEKLVEAHARYMLKDFDSGGLGVGGNSLVVQESGSNGFLVQRPEIAFRDGPIAQVKVMGGTTRDEGTSFAAQLYDFFKMNNLTNKWYFERNITRDIVRNFQYVDPYGTLTDFLHNTYFQSTQDPQPEKLLSGLVDMCGTLLMKEPTYNTIRSLSYRNKVYAYSFNFYGNISKLGASEPDWDLKFPFPRGVAHSDELGYLFPATDSNYTSRELAMVRIMTKLWTNFVSQGTPVLNDAEWPIMSTGFGPYLRISEKMEVRDNIFDEFIVATKDGFLHNTATKFFLCHHFFISATFLHYILN